MDISFSEEQEILRGYARKFLLNECTYSYIKKMWADDKGFTSVTLDELSIKGNRYYVKISAVKI